MADLADRLELELVNVEGNRGAVIPQLSLEFRLIPSNNRIKLDDGHGQVEFVASDGVERRRGPSIDFNLLKLSQISSTTSLQGTVDLDYTALERIEELRDGKDLALKTDILFSGYPHKSDELEKGRFNCSMELIPARWSEILDEIGYHDNRISELDLGLETPVTRDTLAAANANVEQAQEKHDYGDYPGSIVECRHAVERLSSLTGDLDGVLDERKKDELESILGKFEKGFLGGLSHSEEKTNVETALRRDSDFAIGITKTALRYVGTVFEEESTK